MNNLTTLNQVDKEKINIILRLNKQITNKKEDRERIISYLMKKYEVNKETIDAIIKSEGGTK